MLRAGPVDNKKTMTYLPFVYPKKPGFYNARGILTAPRTMKIILASLLHTRRTCNKQTNLAYILSVWASKLTKRLVTEAKKEKPRSSQNESVVWRYIDATRHEVDENFVSQNTHLVTTMFIRYVMSSKDQARCSKWKHILKRCCCGGFDLGVYKQSL